jgi:hypothetical protein
MATQLAYSYAATARILDASGYSVEEIKAFLTQHQNTAGYIPASKLPPIKKPEKATP